MLKNALIRRFLIAALIICCGVATLLYRAKKTAITTPTEHILQTDSVKKVMLARTVATSGYFQSHERVKISATVPGRLTEILVEEGDLVKEGTVIARLDSTDYLLRVQESTGVLMQAEAEYENASTKAADDSVLLASGIISPDALRVSLIQKTKAEGALKSAQAHVKRAEFVATQTTIVAPQDGIITGIYATSGSLITGEASSSLICTMTPRLDIMEAVLSIHESDIVHIKKGQEVAVAIPALPHKRFTSTIRKISYSPEGQNSSTYKAFCTIDNSEGIFRPGMSLSAYITTLKKENALAVQLPALALERDAVVGYAAAIGYEAEPLSEGTSTLWIVQNKILKEQAVVIGDTNEQWAEITEGLPSGTTYLTDVPHDAAYMKQYYASMTRSSLS